MRGQENSPSIMWRPREKFGWIYIPKKKSQLLQHCNSNKSSKRCVLFHDCNSGTKKEQWKADPFHFLFLIFNYYYYFVLRWLEKMVGKSIQELSKGESFWGWDPPIFELLKAPPFICGDTIPPTSFWHVTPRALPTLAHFFLPFPWETFSCWFNMCTQWLFWCRKYLISNKLLIILFHKLLMNFNAFLTSCY